jgi:polyene glycosyltransferase
MNGSDGPILFASTAHAGQINPLLSIAGELSRRGVTGLWFASTDNRRVDIEGSATGSPIHFISCGINDRTKELVEDPAVYAALAQQGPMTTEGFLQAMRWMFEPERLTVEYQRMLAYIDHVQPRLMVIDISTISALDAAMTRRIPFIISVPSTPSALFIRRLPWDYPALGSGLPRQMSTKQKLANFWYRLRLQIVMVTRFPLFCFAGRRIAMRIANPFGSLAQYSDAATAIFCYSVFGLEYPFPVPRHLRLLGAMVPSGSPTTQDSKDELSRWLDSHPSVIYVGLGTLVRLSHVQITALIAAFRRLGPNHHILWKLPDSQQPFLPPGELLPTNVRIEHWIPSQLGVLAHPNVRVFLTHGGGKGFHE